MIQIVKSFRVGVWGRPFFKRVSPSESKQYSSIIDLTLNLTLIRNFQGAVRQNEASRDTRKSPVFKGIRQGEEIRRAQCRGIRSARLRGVAAAKSRPDEAAAEPCRNNGIKEAGLCACTQSSEADNPRGLPCRRTKDAAASRLAHCHSRAAGDSQREVAGHSTRPYIRVPPAVAVYR